MTNANKKVTHIFKSREEVEASVVAVAKQAATLQQKIHNTAISILFLWHEKVEGCDAVWAADQMTKLQGSSPYHAVAFSKWVGFYCPFVWNGEKETWVPNYHELNEGVIYGKTFKTARDGDQFWKLSPAPKPKPVDMFDEFERLLKRGKNHLEKPVEGDVVDADLVSRFTEFVSQEKARMGITG